MPSCTVENYFPFLLKCKNVIVRKRGFYMAKTFPLKNSELKELVKKFPTPFYLYDEKAIRQNMREFTKAFSIFPIFRDMKERWSSSE